jgi:hypothetical protein
MAKKAEEIQEVRVERPERAKLSAEESLKRMKEFPKRKEEFVASVRKGKDRGVSSGPA